MAIKTGMVSLGCSKNRVDSEVLLGMLAQNGYEIVNDPARAQIMFVNTCGFIAPAKQESIDTILEMAQYKRTGQLKKLFVTGCLAQRYGEELYKELPEVDGFMGVSDYARAIDMIAAAERGARPMCVADGARFLSAERVLTTPGYSAYVKISDGCDNRCAYCAIPLIRGAYRSRPYADIIAECEQLAARGVSELTLIAQDTSRYGNDFPGRKLLLPKLLKDVSAISGVKWVRVLYCYPDTVTDELLDEIAGNPKVCPYLDLPLQHIDDELLKRMNRRGDSAHIKRLIERLKARGISARTTMIVGFPGETDEKFDALMRFVRETGFDRLGAFAFSPEEGTPAENMPGQVDEATKARRLDALMSAQRRISLSNNQKRIDKTYTVLTERSAAGVCEGRSALEAPEIDGIIRFTSHADLKPGDYVAVRITGADAYDLTGVMIE